MSPSFTSYKASDFDTSVLVARSNKVFPLSIEDLLSTNLFNGSDLPIGFPSLPDIHPDVDVDDLLSAPEFQYEVVDSDGNGVANKLATIKFVQVPSYHAGWPFSKGRGETPG